LEAYKQSGVVSKKEWIASQDPPRVRPDHLALHGKKVGLDEEWTFADGTNVKSPGNADTAGQSVNCRCAVSPVIET
jgi:uncharacterized protein with gpF-like domain